VIGAGKIGATVAGLLASTNEFQITLADRSPEVLGRIDAKERIHAANRIRRKPNAAVPAVSRGMGAYGRPLCPPRLAAVAHKHADAHGKPVGPTVNIVIEGGQSQPAAPEETGPGLQTSVSGPPIFKAE
jgi:Saccharopine dehydrogenase NADP binding domain